jgi:hypothetical protein
MKKYYLQIPSIIFLFFASFCEGQVNESLPIDSINTVETVTDLQSKLVKNQATSKYNNVHCGLQDRAGNLWFGTTGDGVYRYDGKSFTNFTKNDGLSNNSVWCVYEDKYNKLWFGTDDGVCIYDSVASQISGSKIFSTLRITDNDPSAKNAVWSILQDKTGKFWFGTSNGVYLYDGKSFTNLLFMV